MQLNKKLLSVLALSLVAFGASSVFAQGPGPQQHGPLVVTGLPDGTTALPVGGAGGTYHGPGDTVPGAGTSSTSGGAASAFPVCGAAGPSVPTSLGLGGSWFHIIRFPNAADVNCFNDPVTGDPLLYAQYGFTLWDALRLRTLRDAGLIDQYIDNNRNVTFCAYSSLDLSGIAYSQSGYLTNLGTGILSTNNPDERVRSRVCESNFEGENPQEVFSGLVPFMGVFRSFNGCQSFKKISLTINVDVLINAAEKLDAAGVARSTSLFTFGLQTCIPCFL